MNKIFRPHPSTITEKPEKFGKILNRVPNDGEIIKNIPVCY